MTQVYKSNQNQSKGFGGRPGSRQSFHDRRAPMVYTNENIKAPNIVIIDEDGTNL